MSYTAPYEALQGFTVAGALGESSVAIDNTLVKYQSRRLLVHSLNRDTHEARWDFRAHLSTPVRQVAAISVGGVFLGRTQPLLHAGNSTLVVTAPGLDGDGAAPRASAEVVLAGVDTASLRDALAVAGARLGLTFEVAAASPDAAAEISADGAFSLEAPFGLQRVLGLRRRSASAYALSVDLTLEAVAMLHIEGFGTFEAAGPARRGAIAPLRGVDSALAAIGLPATALAERCWIMGGYHKLRAPIDRVSSLRVRLLNLDGTPYAAAADWSLQLELFGMP